MAAAVVGVIVLAGGATAAYFQHKGASDAAQAGSDAAIKAQEYTEKALKNTEALLSPYIKGGEQAYNEYLQHLGLDPVQTSAQKKGTDFRFDYGDARTAFENEEGWSKEHRFVDKYLTDEEKKRYNAGGVFGGANETEKLGKIAKQRAKDDLDARILAGEADPTNPEHAKNVVSFFTDNPTFVDKSQKHYRRLQGQEYERESIEAEGGFDPAEKGDPEDFGPASMIDNPVYRAMKEQSEEALLSDAATRAGGGLRGGNMNRKIAELAPNMMNQVYQQNMGYLEKLMGFGQSSAAGVGAANTSTAAVQSGNIANEGSARAAGEVGESNAISGGIKTGAQGAGMIVGGVGDSSNDEPSAEDYKKKIADLEKQLGV